MIRSGKKEGFTLIELLVVMGIIAILTLIALPNFRLAQIRAKVGRVKADLTAIATALETYHIDHGKYPPSTFGIRGGTMARFNCTGAWGNLSFCSALTTPVAYLTSLGLPDPFLSSKSREPSDDLCHKLGVPRTYLYVKTHERMGREVQYMIFSMGPSNQKIANLDSYNLHNGMWSMGRSELESMEYDPVHGDFSKGYILRLSQ